MTGPSAFVFGKLPSHGDFIHRGLDPAAVDAWDAWSSAGLARARESLAGRFEGMHDTAPPWRFIIGPGRLGPDWRVGALAPSVDRVGRRFVIIVGAGGVTPDVDAAAARSLAADLENLIYRAFEAGWNADALVEAAAGVALPGQSGAGDLAETLWTETSDGETHRIADVYAPDAFLRMIDPLETGITS